MLAVDVRTLDTDCLFPTGQNADLLSLRFFQKAGEPFVGDMFVNILLKENREIVLSSSRIMSQALSKKKKNTCNVARSGCYPDVAGPILHGQSHQQMHALLQNQEPLSKTRSRDPVSTPVLIPNTYLYPWVIKSGTQNNLTNGVCVHVYVCAHMCMPVCSHQSTGSCCISFILLQELPSCYSTGNSAQC